MERIFTFIAEDKKREHQGMESEAEKLTPPQQPQLLEKETHDNKVGTT